MLNMDEFLKLAGHDELPCVSVYSPTHKAGAEAKGDPIWLKKSLQDVERLLNEWDVEVDRDTLLEPARALLAGGGVAALGEGTFTAYLSPSLSMVTHWPVRMRDGVFVSDRFHLKPIIPTVSGRRRYYVLAISQNQVRLLDCTQFSAEEMELADVPRSLVEALGQVKPDEGTQFHTGTPQGGRRSAMYHGHGAGEEDQAHELFQYFRLVSRGIAPLLDGRSPLIFAGVERHFPIYKEADTYGNLLEEFISGNPEAVKAEHLRERAWELLEPRLLHSRSEALARYPELVAHGRATDDMTGVAISARDGIVEVMFGSGDRERWGRVPGAGEGIEERAEALAGDYDLVDYAAVHTLLRGGTAYIVPEDELPGDSPAAVILRY